MDAIELTLERTAAATAGAARRLARPDAATVAICGCGAQGRPQLAALADVLPLRLAILFDHDPPAAERLAREARGLGLAARVAADLADATRGADVIVTCTTSRTPFLTPEHVAPGAFVAAVGADSPEKSEIHPALMARAKVVADLRAQCAEMGDLRHAIAAGAMRPDDVHAELAELVAGRRAGRTDPAEITLFDSTGTALQDVAAAAMIYERACAARAGGRIALGAP
jgi:ornithine cyclodeaminase/alanine dehydrogenase-like protein (mu-crystallin family)